MLLWFCAATPLPAQSRIGAMAVGLLTRATPAVFGRTFTEGYLTQPNVMADARWRALSAVGTLNLEGYTLRRGELNAGMYGEGYVDRRHPHTLLHEAVLGVVTPTWRVGQGLRASLAAGKGFTAYGTDDPMMRPFVKYPVNHHHAQIIERVLATGALAWGDPVAGRGAALEASIFNGDEPTGPFEGPQWRRFGDCRSGRLTLKPHPSLELQGSAAKVTSPGFLRGGAFDHHQASVSVRYDRRPGAMAHAGHEQHVGHGAPTSPSSGLQYALVEGARTDEGLFGERAFRYESLLAEAAWGWRGATVAVRGESTERPEGERLLDPFRSLVTHVDFQITGVTRWRTLTVHVAAPSITVPLGGYRGTGVVPFVEVARSHATARRRPAVFEPAEFYGNAEQWSLSAGVRLHVGSMRSRMGRYGVLGESSR